MRKHIDNGHGSTIARALMLGVIALCAYGIARADEAPTKNKLMSIQSVPRSSPSGTQFVMDQYLSVETVRCTSYAVHYDFTQQGYVEGAGCVSTGPLPTTPGTLGDITVSFDFQDGGSVDITGCRMDGHQEIATGTEAPFITYTLNCL